MASTEPLTGITVQDQADAATGGTQIGNLAKAVTKFTVPRFTTTGNRDSAYASKVSAGGFTMDAGLLCTVAGVLYKYTGATYGWRPVGPRVITRIHTPVATGIPSGNYRESGVADGPSIASFTLYEPATCLVVAKMRLGVVSTGYVTYQLKIDGGVIDDGVARTTEETKGIHGVATLTAGTHTFGLRAQAVGGDANWITGKVTLIAGIAE